MAEFRDSAGGFFFTSDHHESLITRPKDLYDNATPSGTAMAATCLVRLAKLTGRTDYLAAAEEALKIAVPVMQRAALAAAQSLVALDMYLGPTAEIAVVGNVADSDTDRLLHELRRRFVPNCVIACRDPSVTIRRSSHLDPLFAGKERTASASPTVYVCENFACQAPVAGESETLSLWDRLAASGSPVAQ